MNNNSKDKKNNDSNVKKENQDLPNIPSSTDKIETENPTKKQIKENSKLQKEGKTDNTEKN